MGGAIETFFAPEIWLGEQIGALGHSIGGMFKPEFPSLAIPDAVEPEEHEAPPPLVDEEAARRLAQQRRTLERSRTGRSSLRIDAPVRSPGLATSASSGLRII